MHWNENDAEKEARDLSFTVCNRVNRLLIANIITSDVNINIYHGYDAISNWRRIESETYVLWSRSLRLIYF